MRNLHCKYALETIDVAVVDSSDLAGSLAGYTRVGELHITSIRDMMIKLNVLTTDGKCKKIRRLDIIDHGNAKGAEIGDDWLTMTSFQQHSSYLVHLKKLFAADGFIHIQNCKTGNALDLLQRLANLVEVPVYGGTGFHNAHFRFNFGHYNACYPFGKCRKNVGRPW